MTDPTPNNSPLKVALIGFGEAGSTFARAARWHAESGWAASGWDVLEKRRAAMAAEGVQAGADAGEALAGAAAVLSLVTADAALGAVQAYAPLLAEGALFCDMNSVAPATKRAAAEAVSAAGGRYVDVAVMAPVDKLLAVPLLLAGPDAGEAQAALASLGFSNIRVVGNEVGRASAIKLCRSVMVKGLEALTAEMVLAASEAGVLDEVLTSLDASEKSISWHERADYHLDRMLIHGRRRSEEMREAAAMLHNLGVPPLMTDNTISRQAALGALGLAPCPEGLNAKLDAIRTNSDFSGENTAP